MKKIWEKIKAFFKAPDKWLHMLCCYAIALTVFIFILHFGKPWLAFSLGIVAAVIAGAWKEWHDYKNPEKGTFEIADIVADVIGILAAVGVMLFYLLTPLAN